MIAIKNWFLEKKGLTLEEIKKCELTIERETEKAVLIKVTDTTFSGKMWVPKSCLTDQWETPKPKKLTYWQLAIMYHDYLAWVTRDEFKKGHMWQHTDYDEFHWEMLNNKVKYAGSSYRTENLKENLDKFGIKYMTYQEFKKSLD